MHTMYENENGEVFGKIAYQTWSRTKSKKKKKKEWNMNLRQVQSFIAYFSIRCTR